MKENELSGRLFKFAVDTIKKLQVLKGGNELNVISYQLIKSSTSAGANYEESQAAVSKADFANKIGISLKEMRESNYWFRILKEIFPASDDLIRLEDESAQLKKILASICVKVSSRSKLTSFLLSIFF